MSEFDSHEQPAANPLGLEQAVEEAVAEEAQNSAGEWLKSMPTWLKRTIAGITTTAIVVGGVAYAAHRFGKKPAEEANLLLADSYAANQLGETGMELVFRSSISEDMGPLARQMIRDNVSEMIYDATDGVMDGQFTDTDGDGKPDTYTDAVYDPNQCKMGPVYFTFEDTDNPDFSEPIQTADGTAITDEAAKKIPDFTINAAGDPPAEGEELDIAAISEQIGAKVIDDLGILDHEGETETETGSGEETGAETESSEEITGTITYVDPSAGETFTVPAPSSTAGTTKPGPTSSAKPSTTKPSTSKPTTSKTETSAAKVEYKVGDVVTIAPSQLSSRTGETVVRGDWENLMRSAMYLPLDVDGDSKTDYVIYKAPSPSSGSSKNSLSAAALKPLGNNRYEVVNGLTTAQQGEHNSATIIFAPPDYTKETLGGEPFINGVYELWSTQETMVATLLAECGVSANNPDVKYVYLK